MTPEEPSFDSPTSAPWPDPPQPAVLRGLAGEFLQIVGPYTEADPTALLVQLLAAFGSVIGRSAHLRVEADTHHGNLFAVLVGPTALARKGTSWGHIRECFRTVEPVWVDERLTKNLPSGESLIWQVRDRITVQKPNKTTKEIEEIVADEGVKDKRLLVLLPEFSYLFNVRLREGNTLTDIVRDAWDSGDLRVPSKHSPARATGAHVSIIGHITREELQRHLTETDAANGFANRFAWIYVRRARELPFGGEVPAAALCDITSGILKAVSFAKQQHRIELDKPARALWCHHYHHLTTPPPGLFGSVISRAAPQALRFALLYALLDRSPVIGETHLQSGLALWDYAERSARYLFGDALGDAVADELLRALLNAPDGMTFTVIHNHFGRHYKAARLHAAINLLIETGRARLETRAADGAGRPAQVLRAVREAAAHQKPGDDGINSHNSFYSHPDDASRRAADEDPEVRL